MLQLHVKLCTNLGVIFVCASDPFLKGHYFPKCTEELSLITSTFPLFTVNHWQSILPTPFAKRHSVSHNFIYLFCGGGVKLIDQSPLHFSKFSWNNIWTCLGFEIIFLPGFHAASRDASLKMNIPRYLYLTSRINFTGTLCISYQPLRTL